MSDFRRNHRVHMVSCFCIVFYLSFVGVPCPSSLAEEVTPVIITGTVFGDLNGNESRDPGEKGIANVKISDGLDVVVTGRDGSYRLVCNNLSNSPFIYVVVPSGYKNVGSFYKSFSSNIDFSLVPAPETQSSEFSFAQITDTHVTTEPNTLIEDLTEISSHKPAFVVATGDLVGSISFKSAYVNYVTAINTSPVPVWSVLGNHDETRYYWEFLGPDHYSFDYGQCHFVVVNSVNFNDEQLKWLKKDLSLVPRGTKILVFQHYEPSMQLMDLLAENHVTGIFTGHWHSSKVFNYKGITYVNTPPLRFGGIDVSARGFRIVSLSKGGMSINNYFGGCKEYMTVVSPADGSIISPGKADIRANFYDVTVENARMEYKLDGLAWKNMKLSNKWSWMAEEKGLKPGSHSIQTRVILNSSVISEKHTTFTVAANKLPEPIPGNDWPMFKCNASRTGLSSDSIVTPPLHLAWSKSLGGITHYSSPTVAYTMVYIGVADEENKGNAGVYALDARTGDIRWVFKTPASVRHTVTVFDRMVYAASVDGTIYALDAVTGNSKWTYSIGSGIDRWMLASPLVCKDVIYAGTAPVFVAIDAKTGKLRWQAKSMGSDWISCTASPAAGKDVIYVSFNWGTGLHALDKETGYERWNRVGRNYYSTPLVCDTALYCAVDGNLFAIEPTTGKDIWSFSLSGLISSPSICEDRVYVGSGDRISALDSTSGKELWSVKAGKSMLSFAPYARESNPIISSPAISGGVVYFGGTDGKFYALESETGKDLWHYDLGAPIISSPAVSGNTVYISSYDGTVYAFTKL